jgi:hypothetical protein
VTFNGAGAKIVSWSSAGTKIVVRINPLTVNASTVYVYVVSAGVGAVKAAGTLSVSADGLTATFTPTTPLLPTTAYAVFESGITDLAGNAVAANGQLTIFTTGL